MTYNPYATGSPNQRELTPEEYRRMTNSSDETAEELSARAIKTNRGEWTPFDDLFYHGCCDCGLSHAVRVRRLADGGHENQWTFHAELTAQTRKSGRHPLWDEIERLRKAEVPRPAAAHLATGGADQCAPPSSIATLRLLAKCGSMDLSALGPIADQFEHLDADAAGLQAELASVKACWAEALENVAARNQEIERLNKKCSALALLHYGPNPNAVEPGAGRCTCPTGDRSGWVSNCPVHGVESKSEAPLGSREREAYEAELKRLRDSLAARTNV